MIELSHPLKNDITLALKQLYDPEIPVNIVDLGLIYAIDVEETSEDTEDGIETGTAVNIQMTLTSPGCPVAETFPQMVQDKVFSVPGVTSVKVELVWEPIWTKDLMSETAKFELNMF